MGQELFDVVENVRAHGALGDGLADDTDAIQRAINNGGHVLFPAADVVAGELQVYRVKGPLTFLNDGQRVTFVAGAMLQLESDTATVTISGKDQVFKGLAIKGGSAVIDGLAVPAKPDPCLLIDGADGLLLQDPYVACGASTSLVRIRNATGVHLDGGQIYGVSQAVYNTGLDLGEGVRSFSAVALTIHQLGYGVILDDVTEDVSFVDSSIESCLANMIQVRGRVYGLSLLGVHMEYGSNQVGADKMIVVNETGGVVGGAFTGCNFGGLNDASTDRRVFRISGDWLGVSVFGCLHLGQRSDPAGTHSVWDIRDTADTTGSGDLFNDWDNVEVFNGSRVLPAWKNNVLTGGLQLSASAIQLQSSKLGFFGATPVARSFPYTVSARELSRDLVSNTTRRVLSTLLQDLASLGLIKVQVR